MIILFREEVVDNLNKFLQVDVYGDCGSLTCSRKGKSCFRNINKTYKFYLSFENSLCEVKTDTVRQTSLSWLDVGLCHWEVFQHPVPWPGSRCVQQCQHDHHRSSLQLHQRRGLQLYRGPCHVPEDGRQQWHVVCLLLLVERLLQARGQLSTENTDKVVFVQDRFEVRREAWCELCRFLHREDRDQPGPQFDLQQHLDTDKTCRQTPLLQWGQDQRVVGVVLLRRDELHHEKISFVSNITKNL